MNCTYCESLQPELGFFCPTCFKQTKCKKCNEKLLKDAPICVFCGEGVEQKNSTNNINTIEFSENQTERKFKATFTDTVGQSISESFGMILSGKINSKNILPTAVATNDVKYEQNNTIDAEVEILTTNMADIKEDNSYPNLKEIKLRDLAKTETDWVLVYAFTASKGGTKEFIREDILQLYIESDRKTDARIKGLSQLFKNCTRSMYIKPVNDSNYILLDKGKNKVLEIFQGNSTSKPSNSSNTKKKSIDSQKVGAKTKAKVSSGNDAKFLAELNLRPKDKESLKDFSAKYKINTSEEVSLLIVYYLVEILNETVTLSHVFTCLKELGKKVPTHLKQTLINNKNSKNWIDVTNWDDIKFTTSGMNCIEHDLKK
ncbi:hypothetical protein [Flavobacterium sp. UBA7680]|uniref:hypothetical protein n=1 Tax=Flavobacterium sp. UBA7680 TaxID=1946559 RepID=UPI0025C4F84B|nr:hypothetical protein [Flavobacterium sp. UBA7680]